jgi:hypothetical protein
MLASAAGNIFRELAEERSTPYVSPAPDRNSKRSEQADSSKGGRMDEGSADIIAATHGMVRALGGVQFQAFDFLHNQEIGEDCEKGVDADK